MEKFSRSLSRSLSRSVSSSVDTNKAWRRTPHGGFDGGKSMKTIRLGEHNDAGFSKIKKMFNFTKSKNRENDTSKVRRSSKIASSSDAFQNRLLYEIYKNTSSNDELRSS
ncbi:hypothetical protein Hanom_Chr17g01571831 [Helianthus anomalus]